MKKKNSQIRHILAPGFADDGVALAHDDVLSNNSTMLRAPVFLLDRRILAASAERARKAKKITNKLLESKKRVLWEECLQLMWQEIIPSKPVLHRLRPQFDSHS
jgi:hypothetical protein